MGSFSKGLEQYTPLLIFVDVVSIGISGINIVKDKVFTKLKNYSGWRENAYFYH